MKNPHILVIDDEELIRDLLSRSLPKRGYEVTTAATGAEALQMVGREQFSLVLLDIVLPDFDGMDILVSIRENHPDLPVFIMTGMGFDEELLSEAKTKGANGYLSKLQPVSQWLLEIKRELTHPAQKDEK